ncbi:MAG: DUF4386 domain-containing protein [Candidatus Thorarchaeota archaeon]
MSKTESYKLNAQVAGLMWLLAIVVGIVGAILLGDYQQVETNVAFFSQNETGVLIGSLLFFSMALFTANIAIFLYPVLKKYNESIALSAVGLRLIETALFSVGSLLFIAVLIVSNAYVAAGSPVDTTYPILAHTFLSMNEMTGVLATFAFNAGAFMYCYIFFRTTLVPKWLGVFGVIVTLLGFAGSFLTLFGITDISLFLELPTLFFEIAIGVWLIVKGFNQEVLVSLSQE